MFKRFFEKGLSYAKAELKMFFNPSLEAIKGDINKGDEANVKNETVLKKETSLNEAKGLPEKSVNRTFPFGKQNRLLHERRVVSLMVLVVVLFLSFIWVSYSKVPPKPPKMIFEEKDGSLFSSPLDVSLKEKGLTALEALIKESVLNEASLNKTVTRLEEKLEAMERKAQDTTVMWQDKLETMLKKKEENSDKHGKEDAFEKSAFPSLSSPSFEGPSFHTVHAVLTKKRAKETTPFIPAGSYIEAVLLSGVDVSAGVNATANPKPVLLRTISPFHLPKGEHVDVGSCRVVGAGFGEISSERAYLRLERLSCYVNNVWVDIPVFGYVAGPDGKAGIRGVVVMRDKAMLSRAFLGGLVGGLGETLSQQLTTTSINPLGSTVSVDGKGSLLYGTGTGVNQAANHMADYYIKRAEQYQPVIQVRAGTTVDVVFHQGFWLTPEKEGHTKTPTTVKRETEDNIDAPLATFVHHNKTEEDTAFTSALPQNSHEEEEMEV